MAPMDWVLVVSTGIGGAFGMFCLFDGTRRIALYGSNPASGYLIGVGVAICLALAGYAYWKYSGQGGAQAHFVEFVMWLVWGAAALVFGALFAGEPAPEPAEENTKIEPLLVPPVAARAPQPAAAVAPAKPAAVAAPAAAKPPDAPPPEAPPKPAVRADTLPLAKPAVGEDTVPLPKPRVGEDTVPLPKPGIPPAAPAAAKPADAPPPAVSPTRGIGEDTVPLRKPAVGGDTVPLPKPGVVDDTVPLPKPAPGTFTPPKKT